MLQLQPFQEEKISSVLNIFETGKPELNYGAVYIFPDGNNKRKQVTVSIGFTEDSGSFGKVIRVYIEAKGMYANEFVPYVNRIGKGVLWNNTAFINLIKKAGTNDPIFIETQEFVYRALYVHPSRSIAEDLGLKLPLSILVVQDSKLHGSFDLVRKLFPEVPPISGGDEKKWVKAYCEARKAWWNAHPKNPWAGVSGKGTYRMDTFLEAIKKDNWDLSQPLKTNGQIV
jgi:hypothetical protein